MNESLDQKVQGMIEKGEEIPKDILLGDPNASLEAKENEVEKNETEEELKNQENEREKELKKSSEGDNSGEEKKDQNRELTNEEAQNVIDQELEKPDGEEDLSKLNREQKGIFFSAKKARRRAQKAEQELKLLKEELASIKAQNNIKKDEDLDGADDFISKKEALEIARKEAEKYRQELEDSKPKPLSNNQKALLNAYTQITVNKYEDASQVLNLAEKVLAHDEEAKEMIRSYEQSGKNYIDLTYNLVKSSPLYQEPIQNRNQDPESFERLERIKQNEKKAKTTGQASGDAPSKMSVQEQVKNWNKFSEEERLEILKKL